MLLLMALGLAIAIEGALYAIAPGMMKRAVASVLQMAEQNIRLAGIAALAFGVLLVWIGRQLG